MKIFLDLRGFPSAGSENGRASRPSRAARAWVLVWLLGFGVPLAASEDGEAARSQPFVVSDMAPLKEAIVFSIGPHIFKSSEMGSGSHPFFRSGLPRGTIGEHAEFIRLLQAQGVRLLEVEDLLESAVKVARQRGELADWIRRSFPATADEIIPQLHRVSAGSILNLRDEHFYIHDSGGGLNPLFPGMSSMYWARDFAVSTPRGIIIGHGRHYGRSLENHLARLMFRHADQLQSFPIVFDAEKEGVHLDGGDTLVLDGKTLLLGVGNRTSREAAVKLAQKLDMDVLAVAMPPADADPGLRRQLLHLDSIFNLVDGRTVVAVPFFLEERFDAANPMSSVLQGLAAQIERMNALHSEYVLGDPEVLRRTVELMPRVGWLTRYQAGTGEPTELKQKLVDYFRGQGYRVIYVGGEAGSSAPEQYALERAMYELRWQGANVLQLGPGRVIAFRHNPFTNEALRQAGIKVLTFDGELLSMRNGGPHCLLMPLIRK